MTVEAGIYRALKGLVGDRVWPSPAPQNTVSPYIVYQQIGGDAPVFVMDRAIPSKKNGRFQLTVWGKDPEDVVAIGLQFELLIVESTEFDGKPIGAPISLYDEETKLRGSTQDFSIWSDR